MKNTLNKIKTVFKYKNLGVLTSKTKALDVQSSALDAVEYNAETKELVVDFNRGTKYRYSQVSPEDFYKLVASQSVGKEFVQSIRNSYDFEKIEENK